MSTVRARVAALLLCPCVAALATGFGAEGSGPAAGDRVGSASAEATAPPYPRDADSVAVVEMTQRIRFEPDTARIVPGGVVEWRNVSTAIGHTVTLLPDEAADPAHARMPEGAEAFDSGNIPPGESWRHRFTVPGTYVYYCTPHASVGMIGVIVVGE